LRSPDDSVVIDDLVDSVVRDNLVVADAADAVENPLRAKDRDSPP